MHSKNIQFKDLKQEVWNALQVMEYENVVLKMNLLGIYLAIKLGNDRDVEFFINHNIEAKVRKSSA